VKFGEWYPLSEAADLAPAGEGVLQVRLAAGLIEYPRGKSAMVWYEHAPDLKHAARAFADRHAGKPLVCRHLIEIDEGVDLGAFCASLRDQFERRFGALPDYEQGS
jgi:hypothetical protein